jgi:hypothetical protein
MPVFLRVALAIDLALIVLDGAVPATRRFLPLGGSQISEVGIVLGMAVFLYEIISAYRR